MVLIMMENGIMIKLMDMVLPNGAMVVNTLVSGSMVIHMDQEPTPGKMVGFTRVSFLEVSSMAKVLIT